MGGAIMNGRAAALSFIVVSVVSSNAALSQSGGRDFEDSKDYSLPAEEQSKLQYADPPQSTMNDLLPVIDQLTLSQQIEIGPLTEQERRFLSTPEDGPGQVEKVGIVRQIIPPIRLAGIARSALHGRSTTNFASGRLDEASDGRLVWTSSISSPGAVGLRLEISEQNLPAGTKIYVSDGRREVFGPYAPDTGSIWSNTVSSSRIYVQIQLPRAAADRPENAAAIAAVAHIETFGPDSDAAPPAEAGPGGPPEGMLTTALQTCKLLRFCRPSANPEPERSLLETASLGVAHIQYVKRGGVYVCSGGLLRDLSNSNTPFFLTAHHCFNTRASASSLEAFFRFRAPCGEPAPPLRDIPRTLGSTLLATNSDTDFTLVQLSQNPPMGSHFFRWSADDMTSTTTELYRIHHPKGYSQHWQRLTVRPNIRVCRSRLRGPYIYSNPEMGGTAGGSSGSVVFRVYAGEPQIVGQLFGYCPERSEACGYDNVDGSFARTLPRIREYIER